MCLLTVEDSRGWGGLWRYRSAIPKRGKNMTHDEKMLFTELLFAHRHLWITFQEYRYLQEHLDLDWETAHEIFFEESDEFYNSLAEAVREEQPFRDKLRTVLLRTEWTEVEVRNKMKNQ
jgi:hypothetical protein